MLYPHRMPLSQFEGEPPIVDSEELYGELYDLEGELAWKEALEQAERELNERIEALKEKADSFEETEVTLDDDETGTWVVKEGQTLKLEGGNTAGGTIILDGGTLDMGGNSCFAGMVLGRNGGQISTGGTAGVVGAVLQISGFNQEASMKGNASIYYSSSTLEWAQSIANGGSEDQWTITNFNQVTGQ